ncbi:hypothetical protein DL96DRAFT_1597705 [Flagelloscypha sp. PMI_526]|nr:hypothetical protein DL96DRAFT_1597705 [Flagelloscypha sp. PMI_526]
MPSTLRSIPVEDRKAMAENAAARRAKLLALGPPARAHPPGLKPEHQPKFNDHDKDHAKRNALRKIIDDLIGHPKTPRAQALETLRILHKIGQDNLNGMVKARSFNRNNILIKRHIFQVHLAEEFTFKMGYTRTSVKDFCEIRTWDPECLEDLKLCVFLLREAIQREGERASEQIILGRKLEEKDAEKQDILKKINDDRKDVKLRVEREKDALRAKKHAKSDSIPLTKTDG